MTRPQVASRSEVARGLRASGCAATPRRGSLLYKIAEQGKSNWGVISGAVALSLLCLVGYAAPPCGALTINPAKAVILSVGRDTKGAAEELKLHLDLIGGTDVPVAAKATPGSYTFRFDTAVIGGNDEACSWEVSPTGTVMRGNAYFAVVDFLENALGVPLTSVTTFYTIRGDWRNWH